MKKLLYVTHLSGKRVNRFWISSIKAAKELGFEFHLACNMEDADKDYWDQDCKEYGIITHQIDFVRNPYSNKNYKAYLQMKQLLKNNNFDIIHCNTPIGGVVTRIAARAINQKNVIYQAHGFHFWKGAPLKNWLIYYTVERFLACWTDVLITINKEDYDYAQKFAAKKVYYVPGVGIETSRFAPNPEAGEQLRSELGIRDDEFVLLSVGEVNANKNHQVVVRALPQLKQCKYVICGVGPLGEELKSLAAELGVEKKLLLAGYRSDISRFYQMADCFVFPSLREGLSVALMEAMGAETPIACTAIRGNTDLIEDRVTGYIVKNDPADVARTLQHIIEHKDERQNCAVAAREKLRQFDLGRVVENVRKIYLATLEN